MRISMTLIRKLVEFRMVLSKFDPKTDPRYQFWQYRSGLRGIWEWELNRRAMRTETFLKRIGFKTTRTDTSKK